MGSPARSRSGDTAINSRVLCQLSYGGMNPHKVAALPERFAARVSVQDDGCWIWTGAKASNGYGSIGYESRTHSTHRLAYTLLVGPVPEGLQLDHLCRVKSCCNPAHLEPVTNAENQARRSWPTCKRGHAYSPENTARNSRGWRYCRECENARRRTARSKAAGFDFSDIFEEFFPVASLPAERPQP